jgi:hypothetical protein
VRRRDKKHHMMGKRMPRKERDISYSTNALSARMSYAHIHARYSCEITGVREWNTTHRREIAFALSVNPIARIAKAHPKYVIRSIITLNHEYLVLAVNLGTNRRLSHLVYLILQSFRLNILLLMITNRVSTCTYFRRDKSSSNLEIKFEKIRFVQICEING